MVLARGAVNCHLSSTTRQHVCPRSHRLVDHFTYPSDLHGTRVSIHLMYAIFIWLAVNCDDVFSLMPRLCTRVSAMGNELCVLIVLFISIWRHISVRLNLRLLNDIDNWKTYRHWFDRLLYEEENILREIVVTNHRKSFATHCLSKENVSLLQYFLHSLNYFQYGLKWIDINSALNNTKKTVTK